MLFLAPPDANTYNYSIIKSVGAGLVIDVGSSGATNAITISTAGVVNAPQGLQVGGNSVVSTAGGQTIAGTTYFSGGESLNVYGIRGRFTNEYMHLYYKVGIGHPGGWGQGEGNTPGHGLSTYGGANFAYGNNADSTFNGIVYSTASFRAPIYYDSANTNYYGDFAGTSNLNVLYTNYLYIDGTQLTGTQTQLLKNTLDVTTLPYKVDITVNGDANTFYAVQFWGGDQDVWRRIIIKRGYGETAPWDPIGTGVHHGGLLLDWEGNFGGWGGAEYADRIRVFNESYTNVCADMFIYSHSMGYVFMLRGGGAIYHLFSDQAINGFYQSGSPDILYSSSTLSYDDAWSGTNQYDVYAPTPLTLGQVNSSRIDGLRTKKQSLLDGRYLRQGVDIGSITNISASNFMAANAFYLNGQSYYLNSYNGGIYTNARFESASTIHASGGNSSNWNTAYGWGNHASVGYLTGITSGQVTSALGYTPYNSSNPSGYITSSGSISGTAGSISGFNNPTTASTANTIVYRDASGDVAAREFVLTAATVHTVTPSSIVGIYPTTNQVVKFGDTAIKTFLGLGSLAYSSATIPTNNNQLTNGAGYVTSSGSVNYATTAGSAPNGSNVNSNYDVAVGDGNGLRFWGGSDSYKISMGVGALYQYGPVTDYSIKAQMNDSSTARGFTWGRISYAPIAALNSTSGDMEVAGYFKSYGYRGNGNIGGTGNASWHPDGAYIGSTMWQYGSLNKNNTGIYGVSEMTMSSGPILSTYNTRNLIVRALDNNADVGILGQKSGGGFAFQIYGTGTSYGFLNGTWASWDIRKAINGAMYMNDNDSYYLQTNSTSNFYTLNIQGNAVVHAGNIGSQSVSNSNYINSTRDTPGNALQYWQASGLGITEAPSADWHNTIRMGHGSPLSYYSNTLAVRMTGSGVGDIYTQTIVNGTAQGWKKHWNDGNDGSGSGLDADLLDGQQGSYYQPASTAITTSNIGSQSVSYATTSGALTSMNISQFTNNSGYITGYTETDTLASVTGRGNTTSNSVRFGTHVDLSPTASAFRFYDGTTFRGGFGLDSWGHSGSDANLVLYVSGDNTLFFSTSGTKRASLSSTAFNSLVALQQSGNQVLHAGNYTSYSPSLTGSGASGTWNINVTGNVGSATTAINLNGLGSIQSTSTGTSYSYNYQVRENAGGGGNTNEIYAPQLAFHWSGVVASSIMMESSGRMAIRNNPGGSYENFIAAVIYSSGYGDSTQWNTAYGWGNHASAGYQAASTAITTSNIGSQSVSYATTAGTANAVAWTNVSSRPTALSQFTNDLGNYGGFLTSITAHTHAISDVTGLQTALDSKQASLGFTPYNSTNPSGYITSSGSISGNAATATSAGTVTGSSTINGYLTLSTNWGVSPYTSALTIIGTHPSMTFRGSNGDTHYLIHMDSAGDIQYYFGPGYTTNNWTQRYTFTKGGNFSVLTGNISASGTVTGSNLSGTNTGDQTNISGNAATATNVAWTGVTSRPTALSQFSNDLGNYGGWLTTSGKAADSELIDGIDSFRIVYGDGDKRSTNFSDMNAYNQSSGFFFYNQPTGNPFGDWTNWINVMGNSWNNNYGFQLAHAFHGDGFAVRRVTNGSFASWRTIIDSGNIGSQSVSYASTSGSAGSATTAGSLTSMNISQFTNNSGYITGINSGNVTTALGFTPYNATNPSGYITSSGSISGNAATATNVAYSGLTGTVPTWNQNTTGSAATVGGYAPSGSVGANTVVIRDANNYIYAHYINSNVSETENPTINSFYTSNGDGWLRKSSVAHVKSQLGLGSMAYESSGTYQTVSGAINTGNIASQSVSYATVSQQLTKFGDIYGQDWNSYFITAKLIVSNALGHTGANRPSDSYGYGTVLSYGETGGPLMQMYFPEDVANTGGAYRALAYRSGYNGSWSAWKTVVNQVGNTCTVAGSNGTGLQVHSNVGYNQNPLTYFLLRGQADSSWKTFKILLTGDAGGQDIEFRRIAENSTDARMFYVPRGLNQVIFDYTVVQPSDSRLKDNLTLITTPVDKIKSLRGVEFDWNSGEHVGTHDVGLIAQDVEAVLPEAVTTQEDGYKNLAYTKVIPLLVEAMKEQQTMIEALRAEIELLKNK
jgi:hypothetical protein